jgi:hypothetical protein
VSTIVGVAAAISSVAVVQLASAGSASAAACISSANAKLWTTTSGGTKSSPTYTTTANCRDVNFSWYSSGGVIPTGRVRVCFVGAGYCQSTWKTYSRRPE